MRLRPAALAAALCAACSSPPPPPPTVAISAPPAAPPVTTAAPLAAPSASADAVPEEAGGPRCAEEKSEATQLPHTSMESCDEMQLALLHYFTRCEPDMEARVWSVLEAAECRQDVLDDTFEKLKATLPAADQAKQAAAHETYRSNIQDYCVRYDCGITFTAGCTSSVLNCGFDIVDAARQGALRLDKTGTPSKETVKVFSEYAKTLCALPKTAWKDGKVPAGCVNRLLYTMEDCFALPQVCVGP